MADKKTANPAAQAQSDKKKTSFFGKVKNFFKGIAKFFRDTASEMKKVVWPSRKQVIMTGEIGGLPFRVMCDLMDVDGTLLDFNKAEVLGIREVMKAYGVEPSKEKEGTL